MSSELFTDKTVIITGASAGVGAACARAFAKQGANLVLVARGQAALDTIAEELTAQTKVLTVAMDVADMVACQELLKKAEFEFGRIDVLVNNAGLHVRGDVEQNQAEDIAAMVDVNLRAPLMLTSAVLPLAGMAPLQGAATYSATKSGLRTFSYALADELRGSGIQVSVVSPGPIDTGFIMDEIDKVEDIVFSQPMSSAVQVADNVVTLASSDQVEIVMPASSKKLLIISYLFPALRRKLRGALYAKGRKNKEKYRQRNQSE
jgi:short-subunit dehydrogenase